MYTTELRKYNQLGSAIDSRGKLVNAPVLRISDSTIKSLPSLCRKETNVTSSINSIPKHNIIDSASNVSN